MEQQLSCSLGGEKVNKSSSTQDVTSLIPTETSNMVERAKNVDVDIVLTQLHGPSHQHSPTRCAGYQHSPTRCPAYIQSPTQTTVHTCSNTNPISPLTTNHSTIPVSVSGSQSNQPIFTCQSNQPSRACTEKEFNRNKKVLKTIIARATPQLDHLQELVNRSSTIYLEIEKPVFECCELTDPLIFLEHLEVYLKRVPNSNKIRKILGCLEKCAARWAVAVKEYWHDVEDFKICFIAKFWGNAEQNLLRKEITYGRYTNELKDGPMANYFINLVAQARWLPYQIPDESLIYEIMHHFPKSVQLAWNNSPKKTVLEAVEFLRKMDDIEMLSNAQNRNKKCKYKLCPRGNPIKEDDLINFKMSLKFKMEEIQKCINRVTAIKEGIKIAECATFKMLSQSQKDYAISVLNEKLQTALQRANNLTREMCELEEVVISNINRNKRPYFVSPESCHPLNFLEDLMDYLERIPVDNRTVDYIVDCLYGDAHRWAMIFKERWRNIGDFQKDFLEQYWGPAEQSLLKREIIGGEWDRGSETMTQHFTRLVSQAQLLTPPIPENELILDIMCHFSENVQDAWQSSGKSSIEEASAFLQKKDEEIYCKSKSQQIYNATDEENAVIRNSSYNKLNQSTENNEQTSTDMKANVNCPWNKVEKNIGEIAKCIKEKSKDYQKKKVMSDKKK